MTRRVVGKSLVGMRCPDAREDLRMRDMKELNALAYMAKTTRTQLSTLYAATFTARINTTRPLHAIHSDMQDGRLLHHTSEAKRPAEHIVQSTRMQGYKRGYGGEV
jgi:hypothetical protein